MSAQLLSKIKNKKFQVGIIGLGYVGLPLAIRFLNAKINVIGFETDSDKNRLIQNGICYIENKKFKNDKYFRAFRKIRFEFLERFIFNDLNFIINR